MAFCGRIKDINRERRIARLKAELASCPEEARNDVWDRLKAEINSRSSRQVRRMERDRGLA